MRPWWPGFANSWMVEDKMDQPPIETDYLIIGAGAAAMAFVDTLLSESDAQVVIVDRHHQPGGHWNDAYSFVRLHQPSAFYGVNSHELDSGAIDTLGLNRGLHQLASGAELLSYFEQVMDRRFLPSGRVRYFPMSNYAMDADGEHRFTSLLTGRSRGVTVHRKVVDATHARTATPSTHLPQYAIAAGVQCVPLNQLPQLKRPPSSYVVVGSGKTGIDACLWLLQNEVAPSKICWIMPRDAWFLDRANNQPGQDFFEQSVGGIVQQLEAIIAAKSIPDLFARLEAAGQLLRLDENILPTAYHCATVSMAELSALRRIENVVRLGRVEAIEPTRIVLEQGAIAHGPDSLIVDCSANGIPPPPVMPVFAGNRINLLMVGTCQPVFSAALIAYVESHIADEIEKNTLCRVVPSPVLPLDWLRMWAVFLDNGLRWGRHRGLTRWLLRSRLNGLMAMMFGLK